MNISLDQVVDGKVIEDFAVTDSLGALVTFGIVSLPYIPTNTVTNA